MSTTVISAIFSFCLYYMSMFQIVGLLSVRNLVKSLKKSEISDDYDTKKFIYIASAYLKNHRSTLVIHFSLVIIVLVIGFVLGKDIFYGCLIGAILSFLLASSKESALRDEFFDNIESEKELWEPQESNSEIHKTDDSKTIFCRKCGAKLDVNSKFCNKCGTEVIHTEE